MLLGPINSLSPGPTLASAAADPERAVIISSPSKASIRVNKQKIPIYRNTNPATEVRISLLIALEL